MGLAWDLWALPNSKKYKNKILCIYIRTYVGHIKISDHIEEKEKESEKIEEQSFRGLSWWLQIDNILLIIDYVIWRLSRLVVSIEK